MNFVEKIKAAAMNKKECEVCKKYIVNAVNEFDSDHTKFLRQISTLIRKHIERSNIQEVGKGRFVIDVEAVEKAHREHIKRYRNTIIGMVGDMDNLKHLISIYSYILVEYSEKSGEGQHNERGLMKNDRR